jgi:hypothetical protein
MRQEGDMIDLDHIGVPADPSAFDLATAILNIVADAEGCQKRLGELRAATTEAKSALDEAAAARRALAEARAEHGRVLAADRAEHDRAMNGERNKWSSDWEAREKSIRGKEARTAELLAKAHADAAAAEKLRGDLQSKMDAIRSAAA